MRHPPSTPPNHGSRRPLQRLATLVAVAVGLLAVYSCSLIVETRGQQCQVDGDCAAITNGVPAHCDPTMHVCVANATTGSGTSSTGSTSSSGGGCDVDGGIDAGGCWACAPTDDAQYLNACTTGCIPFDDTKVNHPGWDGGALPGLPMPGPDGGM